MTGQAIPLFRSGNLLRKEMLSAMKDYTFGFGELLFRGYGDGVLSGCDITTTSSTITVNKGILVYKGILYLIQESLMERYFPTEETTVFKIIMKEEVESESFIYRELESCISKGTNINQNELELCRFKLQKGFKLRTEYVNFYDRATEFDTVNRIHGRFSAFGESSLAPEITRSFAESLDKLESNDPLDMLFCMQAYESHGFAMNRGTICTYIAAKMGIEKKNYTNSEIFHYMCEILRNVISKKGTKQIGQGGKRKILLD